MLRMPAKTVILFGAGASFGSETASAPRPPLANDLYEELAAFSPDTWGKLPGEYPAAFRKDFEQAFGTLGADAPSPLTPGFSVTERHPADLTNPLLHKMAQYFARFGPSVSSQYAELARRIISSDWSGWLVSLNYDLLLPLAFRRHGLTLDPTEIRGELPRLCLPHGSCAMFLRGGGFQFPSGTVFRGLDNRFTGGCIGWESDPTRVVERLRTECPVMSYFEYDKRTFRGWDFLKNQRREFQAAVLDAETVVVVGTRVRPRDGHIWNPLDATPARIVYASPETGEFEDWSGRRGRRPRDVLVPGPFDEAIDAICTYASIG